MKQKLLVITFIWSLLSVAAVQAQISQGGTPRSFDATKSVLFDVKVPVSEMAPVDVAALRAEDALVDQYKDRPWRFGENLYVDLDVRTDGVETILPNGDKVYRLAIYSPGATSINLTFDYFQIPDGADLFVYNESGTDVIGAFTSENNQSDFVFATSLVQGDKVILEYYEPSQADFSGHLHLFRVTHGYRGIKDFAKAFGGSGSCNVNVACPQSAGWENEINSVCMLVSGGAGFCTGALINNTAEDGTPYILTADHCYSTPSSWVFYFNWQSATCTNPGASPAHDDISGAVLRARNAASDFCLVEMNSVPPASYGVYYAGWNRSTAASISGTIWGIHHPSADIKKISWSTLGVTTTSYLATASPGDNSHWRITSWADGTTTEGGSSGSPLFDPNHRIIGQLHGGYAACGNTDSDWYGKLGVSWTGGGTSATRLSNWLDPSSTGATVLDGYDPNAPTTALDAQISAITSPSGSTCGSTTVTPVVTLRNAGSTTLTSATIYYRIDGGTSVSQAWTGSLTTGTTTSVTFPSITSTYGAHTIDAWSSAPNGGVDQNLTNDTASASFTLMSGSFNIPFVELFNNGIPPSCWASFIGTNGLGTNQNWKTTTTTFEGTGAAYVQYENVTGGTAEDWLVTPLINLQNGSAMSFYQRQSYTTAYGSTYSIRVSTSSQTSPATFTTVSSWAESTFSTAYTKKTIDLSAYNGQSVYIAFVMTNDDGDDWFVDSLKVYGTCTNPVADFTSSATTACPNTTVTFTDGSTGTPTSWNWSVSPATFNYVGGTSASSQNPQIQFTAAGSYTINLTSTNSCGSDAENKTNYITVTTAPAQPSAITGNTNPCSSATGLVYSVTNVGGVTYNWSVPTGWTITSGSGTNSITVTAGTSGGTISVTPNNGCDGPSQSVIVTTNTVPAQPSTITGNANPCQSETGLTYSVTNVAGVTYTWSVPSGWSITAGQGTYSITVSASSTSGSIGVTPSNTCGNGTAQSLSVAPVVVPVQPSAISGDATPCEASSQNYSVTNVAGTTYTWSFPTGWTINSGQGSNSVSVTTSATGGTVSVTPSNSCGTGTAQTLPVSTDLLPAQPSAITGDASPCESTSQVYSVTNVGGISYTWAVPAGWSITAGQGSNSITVTTGTSGGTISVTPGNTCGSGTAQTMMVSVDLLPAQPVISGLAGPCQLGTETYSVTPVIGETYTWTVPGDWTINSGQGTSSITVTVGTMSGNIQVTPSNGCGNGTAATYSVTASILPSQPSTISGDNTPCEGSSQNYSVTNVAGITYSWTFPVGWTQTGGGTSNSVNVTVGTQNGDITVIPSNGCGNGTSRVQAVTIAPDPTVSLGADTVICNDQSIILDAGSGFSSYMWSTTETTQTIVFDGVVAGIGVHNISVSVTNAEGCTGSDMISVEVINCTGLVSGEMSTVLVYPNPAGDYFNIRFGHSDQNVMISLFDASGRLIESSFISSVEEGSTMGISVSDLNGGVYTLQINSESGLATHQVIVY